MGTVAVTVVPAPGADTNIGGWTLSGRQPPAVAHQPIE
jgi:hypothetical protein